MSTVALRRLYAAPDDAHELIATCNHGCVPYGRYDSATNRVIFKPIPANRTEDEDDEDTEDATVRLPFPATDLSWCPAKAKHENAAFLSACNSQPLQLWDCEDGEMRASYVAENDSGNHTHPRCCGWLMTPAGQLLAMGGYGGHEDRSPVRFFDILREGAGALYAYDSSYHAGASSSNNAVSALSAGPHGSPGLALAGYRNHVTVDVIDVRHRCPAAVLTGGAMGQRGCVRTIRPHPTADSLIFASGARHKQAQNGESILCWDLRKPSQPLVALNRGPALTHQVCDFVFVKGDREASEYHLVSTSSAAGLYAFDLSSALLSPTEVDTRPIHAEALGATSGIASLEKLDTEPLSAGSVAVVVGSRQFNFTAAATAKRRRADEERKKDANTEEESDDNTAFLRSYRKGKRVLAAMEDEEVYSNSDAEGSAVPAANHSDEYNVTVVKLAL